MCLKSPVAAAADVARVAYKNLMQTNLREKLPRA
jgi:hypothetical protein